MAKITFANGARDDLHRLHEYLSQKGAIQNYAGPFFRAVYPSHSAPQNALQWLDWLSLKGPLLLVRWCPRSFELHPLAK